MRTMAVLALVLAGVCLLTAMIGRFAYEGHKQALYCVLLGVNSLFIFVFAQICFYKTVLNKAI